ncbi:tail fiber assembly protein [Candidatus Schmidhempelia bombi]|uniref:Tail fiber assembly protein n=1 Tax=Candidatus Schmidhempelia bombi str. Bimp TaxID=1387197 RepID=A0AB94IC15_9GAMM|nr:tail fiber assembly protein [Candidatus Schmidhempelia bombi]TEA26951.1 hypothetical protein O970_06190 [Candidatus Schmidhempelia bombi str. Bimp]
MKYFKDTLNKVYAYEDDIDIDKYVNNELIQIEEREALELSKTRMSQEDIITNNKNIKKLLIDEANQKIAILQDIINLEMQESNEDEQLKKWKKYRILLTRIDTDNIEIKWPEEPQ